MAGSSNELTVTELERILAKRKKELEELLLRRDQLQQELAELDRHISELQGEKPLDRPVSSSRTLARGRNPVSLRQTVISLLEDCKEGYTLADLSDKIIESGYQTSSKNFRNVLYQCLYNTPQIFHDPKTGTYRKASKPSD